MMNDIKLTGARTVLVPLGFDFFDRYFAYSSDVENTKLMCFLPCDRAECAAYLSEVERQWSLPPESQTLFEFAVLEKDSAETKEKVLLGNISLEIIDSASMTAEFGWILSRKYWHQGYMGEAAFLVKNFAKSLGIRKIIAHCDSENEPSYRLMERLGMRRISVCGGRKNKGSDEERQECLYEMQI